MDDDVELILTEGLGNGINTTTVPIYQAEMSESSRRGAVVMGEVAFVIFGIAFSKYVTCTFDHQNSCLLTMIKLG